MGLNFEQASRVEPLQSGIYGAFTDASWQQGRGVFGGLILALVVRASQMEGPDYRLRSLSMEFVAPVRAGDLTIHVRGERSGLLVTRQSVRVYQEEKLVGLATLVRARDRSTAEDFHAGLAPVPPPLAQLNPLPFVPPMPAFTQHFQYYPCLGAMPFGGQDATETGGWLVSPGMHGVGDTALIVALLDAWFPAWLVRMDHLVTMATVSFHAQFQAPWGAVSGSEPVVIRNTSDVAVGGYATEYNKLWASDGRLLACAQQLLALL